MLHFSPVSPFYFPFKLAIKCDCFLLFLVSSQKFNITSSDSSKTSSTLYPPQKSITTASSRQATSLQSSKLPLLTLHYFSHPSNKYKSTLLVIHKSCFFITPILIFDPLVIFPNKCHLVVQDVAYTTLSIIPTRGCTK